MKICDCCFAQGCAVCNWNGVVGEYEDNLAHTRTKVTDADRAAFRKDMENLRTEFLGVTDGCS